MDRYFHNPYDDYKGGPVNIDENYIRSLIHDYVGTILVHTNPNKVERNQDQRGDLYVGNAGIAYMFLRLHQSQKDFKMLHPLENAQLYIQDAKNKALSYAHSKKRDERCAFLCGNAGIYSVAAVISSHSNNLDEMKKDLRSFESGYEACKPISFSKYGSDEILVGRAGYLSGIYWLNKQLKPEPFKDQQITELCQVMIDSGRQYSAEKGSSFPLMYQYHGTEYLGAAHGLCAILHMMLESPWFKRDGDTASFKNISKTKLEDIKKSIDAFVALQNDEGNFPCAMEDLSYPNQHPLIHWCHGAPGAIYLLAKSYIIFREEKYLNSCRKAADLIWRYGLLQKGPGICHGVAGNGYVFLVLYRLTGDVTYLYQASKFGEFLQSSVFLSRARTPDCPFSLYEGLAALQESDGNFPIALGSTKARRPEKRLVHWCHGAPGVVYLLAKAYIHFKSLHYLEACKKAADLIWKKGLLLKGPGICHGVAGNGYVFLMLYKLTNEDKFLYRAMKFAKFLKTDQFFATANTPDRPYSLYEGVAGTVCFLVDLLEPDVASFPFMDIF